MNNRPNSPYWLAEGPESCSSCTRLHVYEMQYRCVACDRGICCHCVSVSVATREVLCAECAAEDEVQ